MEWSIQSKLDKKAAKATARKKWQKHFAFIPVQINAKMHWLETVYRKEHAYEGNWQYSTLMDILKQEEAQVTLNAAKQAFGQAFSTQGFAKSQVTNDEDI